MPYKCRVDKLECQRRYRERNRDQVNQASRIAKQKDRSFRNQLLSQFPCLCCGEPDPDLIQWHHVVPEDKSFGIIAGNSYSHDAWWNEVLKCVPLCANCHVKIHKNKLCLIPQR